ncbi:unnamed protein product [Paramecium sonneborni]|uniref:FCP1 homology domain-containing protein n=1 Tax=Paramecium sonneborni TaxID=65129 RepID=A0A8S1NYB4_9CILI|nr:unnamed protein product [Paramecium sonneborni]
MFCSKLNSKMFDYQNTLDVSSCSNKSRGSFKENQLDNRNFTPKNPTNRPQTARLDYSNPQKVKQFLNSLVQDEINKATTQLFGQNGISRKEIQNNDNKGDCLFSSRTTNTTKQKTPKNNETFLKSTFIVPEQNRELDHRYFQNLYYQYNKKKDLSSQNSKANQKCCQNDNSQLTKQSKQKNSTPIRQNIINNENINTINMLLNSNQKNKPQNFNTTNQNSSSKKSCPQMVNKTYFESLNVLKQRIDNTIQSKQSSDKKSIEKIINISPLHSPKLKRDVSNTNSQDNDETLLQTIIKLLLEKEQLWNDILNLLDNLTYKNLVQQCDQLQKLIILINDKQNSEYLFKVEPKILETLLYESQTNLILITESQDQERNEDQNIKNLIQYILNSNLYVFQILLGNTNNVQLQNSIKQRIELRSQNNRKQSPKGSQALQKNNFIIKSILGLMIDEIARPEIQLNISIAVNTLDQFLNQQKKLSGLIEKLIPKKVGKSLKNQKEYTLVLDLDETLVHYQEFPKGGGQFLVRPFAEEFIETLSKYYEIVIFTAALPDYANFIIDILDKNEVVQQRLYRDQTVFKNDVYIKDLSILNKNLSKVIIVDNMPENFQLQPENGIYIQSWFGDVKDRALKDLQPLLEQIVIKKCKDIRIALNQFREQMIEKVQQGIKNPYQCLQLN